MGLMVAGDFATIRNWGRSELGAQSGRKNPPACLCLCVFLCVSDRHGTSTLQR